MAVTYPVGKKAEVEIWLLADLDDESKLGPWRRLAAAAALLVTGVLFMAPPAISALVLAGWLR